MREHRAQTGSDLLQGESLSQIRLRIDMDRSPASVAELMTVMREQGHAVDLISMKEAGVRPFGVIGCIRVDGIDCVAKLAGEHLPEDHPDYFEAYIRQGAIEQEYEGLKAATGLTPKLIGEIVAQNQTVGVLKQFIEGTPLADAIRNNLISPEDALRKAIELAQAVNDLGYKLWDCEPNNLWLRPDGSVILIEGQCLTPHSDKERNNPNQREETRKFVEVMLGGVIAN